MPAQKDYCSNNKLPAKKNAGAPLLTMSQIFFQQVILDLQVSHEVSGPSGLRLVMALVEEVGMCFSVL